MLYVIRHGQTDWNARYKMQGRTDIPLNADGIQMAKDAKERYKDVNFDICFVSPLTRARQTAEYLLEGRTIEIVPDDRLMEMSFGEFEGTENVFQKPDCPMYKFFKDPENYVAEGGAESFEELFTRTGAFYEEKVKPLLAEGKDVLIVGHGAMNNSIVNRIRQIPIARFWDTAIPNCELIAVPEAGGV